ncbi:hypothetical protein MZD04_gp315 [Pseudomonas phage Psa21]|uniref:Uncharacterized protein n=1 Tax=Pseudomonas phage Psa21 TaxID=2530023 RepID=A0A481W4V3_9CAUD|nr:hypothetical protein MZD04_gp315 [Pseudomonas phage Psa21]QBJ02841.1 hypothetical protein PSA21_315 [Pseudomonas phage Psa21]
MTYEEQRKSDIVHITDLQQNLLRKPQMWKDTSMIESKWIRLLAGEEPIDDFIYAINYLLKHWLSQENITCSAGMHLFAYFQVWACFPQHIRDQHTSTLEAIQEFLRRPECTLMVFLDVLDGPHDVSEWVDIWWDRDVLETYVRGKKEELENPPFNFDLDRMKASIESGTISIPPGLAGKGELRAYLKNRLIELDKDNGQIGKV